MKEKILNFFKHDRTWSSAIKLYMEIGPRLSIKQKLNVYHEDDIRGIVYDDFREMLGISHAELQKILRIPVQPLEKKAIPAAKKPAAKKPAAKKTSTEPAQKPAAAKK
jgi:hypothetical protein